MAGGTPTRRGRYSSRAKRVKPFSNHTLHDIHPFGDRGRIGLSFGARPQTDAVMREVMREDKEPRLRRNQASCPTGISEGQCNRVGANYALRYDAARVGFSP